MINSSVFRAILPFSGEQLRQGQLLESVKKPLGVWGAGEQLFFLYQTLSGRVKAAFRFNGTVEKLEAAWIKAGFPLISSDCYAGSKAWITVTNGSITVKLMHALPGGAPEDAQSIQRSFIEGVQEALVHAGHARGKGIIAVLGPTGTGKSVLVNQFLGVPVREQDRRIVAVGEEVTPIGHRPATAQTYYAKVFSRANKPYVFADCGGFFDTRGLSSELVVTASMKLTLEAAASVKLVLCIPYSEIDNQKAAQLIGLLRLVLQDFLRDPALSHESLLVLFTKPGLKSGTERFNRADALQDLRKISEDLEQEEREGRDVSHALPYVQIVLREEGKYVGVYNPLDPASIRDVEDRLNSLVPIGDPVHAFKPAYSATAMEQIVTRAYAVAGEGKRLLAAFKRTKRILDDLKEMALNARNRKREAKAALEAIRLNSDPVRARADVEQIVRNAREQNAGYERDLANLRVQLRQANEELEAATAERAGLNHRMDEEIFYRDDTFFYERRTERRHKKIGPWSFKSWNEFIPSYKTFIFRMEQPYLRVQREPNRGDCWSEQQVSQDKKSYSIKFTSKNDMPAGTAKVSIFCKKRHHPEVMRVYHEVGERQLDARNRAIDFEREIALKQASIRAGEAFIIQAQENLENYEGFKLALDQARIEKDRVDHELPDATDNFRRSKETAERFVQGESFLETLLSTCRDTQLDQSQIIQDYIAGLREFREIMEAYRRANGNS